MTLSDGDLHYIGQYVRAELPGWLKELGPWALGSELMERMIRVEEELKSQRELLLTHVQVSERRFDDVNRRFEDVNKRFEDVNERFDDVNKRFDDVNKRFDDVGKRFDDNSRRHTATQWAVGVGFVVLTTLITLYQFLG
jgi:predicted nuclease with TOPRIM domain